MNSDARIIERNVIPCHSYYVEYMNKLLHRQAMDMTTQRCNSREINGNIQENVEPAPELYKKQAV
jgi:hypothetical protein